MPFGRIYRKKKYTESESLVHLAVKSSNTDPSKKITHYVGIAVFKPGQGISFKYTELVTPNVVNHVFTTRSQSDLEAAYRYVLSGNKACLDHSAKIVMLSVV